METGKPGLASVPVHVSSITTQAEKRMNIQVPPLTAVYLHTMPPAAAEAPLQLAMPPFYSKETLPFLTLHIASGLQPLPSLSLTAPATKPKSAGKHICPHCGRDCLKPSVLEKHLRCHTGERPYPCSTCGVSFKTQSNLYKHRRTQAHARLSSESEQSSLGSQDSMSSSKETCTSSLSLDEQREETGSMESCFAPLATESTIASSPTKIHCAQMQGSDKDGPKEEHKQPTDNTKPLGVGRHLPLQRQEATLFSKQWDCSVSKRKSQSHGSTDSGFSDSPGNALLDHSMDSLTESSKEHVEQSMSKSSERAHSEQEPPNTARKQEQQLLVERISKLISENTAVVEDKQLENVRPRKTVLSKQGSIDLPMPYTYKNSFHFDMKISPTQNIGLKRQSRSGLCSVPSTAEHAPLIRSHSLPFNLTLMQPERSSSAAPHQSDYVTAVQSGSSSQISSTDLSRKPANQNSSAHRLLVRQTAVDCNHATDGPFTNLSVEEVCTGSLSWDGDGGDICGESNTRKFRKKKAEKFAYNKWYMYGDGMFKKLCDLQKNANNISFKGKNCQHEVVQVPVVHQEAVTTSNSATNFTNSGATACGSYAGLSVVSSVGLTLQKCHLISTNSSIKAPPRRNLSLSVLPLPATGSLLSHKMEAGQLLNFPKHSGSSSQLSVAHVPSDRKKQRTDGKTTFSMETNPNRAAHPPTSVTCSGPLHDTNLHKTPKHTEPKGALFLPSIPVSTSPAMSISVTAKNTFLPKYQLKLPNALGETLESASYIVGKSKGTEECVLSSSLLPNTSDQTFPSGTTCAKTREGSFTLQTYKSSSVKASCSTENQLIFPRTVTTLCDDETSQSSQSLTSSPAVLHRQCTTTTTSSLQDSWGRMCTVMQSVPLQPAQHCTPAAVSRPLTTAKYPTCVANTEVVSHHRPYLSPSLLQEQLSVAQDSTNPQNKANVGPDGPVVPCSIGSLNQSAQNIFHVHTADFQICLQIISDEQLALIVPQIEHASGPSQSQMCDIKAVFPECSQNKSQSVGPMEISNKAEKYKQPETQKETDGRESPLMLSTERITPQMSEHSGTTTSVDESVSSIGPSQQTHRSSHVSVVTQTQSSAGSLMSASLKNVKLGGTQTLEDEQAADNLVLQGETASQTVSGQHKLSMSPLSAHSVATQSNRVGPSGSSPCTLETSAPQLQDRISSDSSETCLGQFISQTSRVQDVPAICSSSQILAAGLVDGGSLEESAAQKEQKSKRNADTPAEPESSDWGSNCCEGKAEMNHQSPEEHGVTAMTGKQKKRRIKVNKQPDSNCRDVLLLDRRSQQEEETQIQGESFQIVRLSEQQAVSFSQVHSKMLKSPSASPQEALSPSQKSGLPVSLLKVNVVSPSQRNRESIVQNQQMQTFFEFSSSQHAITPQNRLTRPEPALQSFSHQEQNQSSFHVPPQQEEDAESNCRTTGSCSRFLTSESLQHTSFSSDFRTLSSMQFSQVCQEDRTPAGLTANSPTSKNMHNTGPLSEPFTHLDPTTAHEHTGQSNDCGRPDIINKYQSFFMVSSLCGFQPSEGQSSAVRPVAISQNYREDTGSSDDEGKLIIEL